MVRVSPTTLGACQNARPTRRDTERAARGRNCVSFALLRPGLVYAGRRFHSAYTLPAGPDMTEDSLAVTSPVAPPLVLVDGSRSEEHTSELQSRGHLVCRLLLEKKNYLSSVDASDN